MVVAFATHIFSNHVAKGLSFYMNNPSTSEDFYDAEGTINLTTFLNDSFDVLNSRYPKQGLRLDCENYKVLTSFLEILNEEMKNRRIDKSYIPFASDETLAGLRVTVQSTVDIANYLIKELGFAYVLTVKFNQDALEKFFGLIRAAGGREEHPTIRNFLYLHRLLSMYNPCKRVLRGNIRDETDDTVLCRFRAHLRKSAVQVQTAQSKIDEEIRKEIEMQISRCQAFKHSWEEAMRDHTYTMCTLPGHAAGSDSDKDAVNKTIVFQLSGYVAFKFRTLSDCTDCYKSLYVSDSSLADQEYRTLLDINNRGPLHFPSPALFRFISYALEPAICSIIEQSSFFGDMLLECIKKIPLVDMLELGCSKQGHCVDLLTVLIPFYVNMRFDFWCRSIKDKVGKGKYTRAKRKESKLV